MTYLRAGVAALAALAISACADDATHAIQDTNANESELFARSPLLWPRPANGGPLQLRVCWKNPGRAIPYPAPLAPDDDMAVTTTEYEGWARQAIEETWQRELAIDFVGWGPCVGGEDIPIVVTEWTQGSKVDYFGSRIRDGAMRLNLTHGDAWRFYHRHVVGHSGAPAVSFWVSEGCNELSWAYSSTHPEFVGMDRASFNRYYRTCLSSSIVHEFGHALGFLHEQYRHDGDDAAAAAEQQCFEEARTKWGDDVADVVAWTQPTDLPLGPFDPESIMSYCRHDWTTYQPTANDYAFAASLYGWR